MLTATVCALNLTSLLSCNGLNERKVGFIYELTITNRALLLLLLLVAFLVCLFLLLPSADRIEDLAFRGKISSSFRWMA